LAVFGILIGVSLFILRTSFDVYLPGAGQQEGTFTLDNYAELGSSANRSSVILTLRLALETTIVTMVLGYPIALYLVHIQNPLIGKVIMFALLMPLLMNLFLQAYGWMIMLGPAGLLNNVLLDLGLIQEPLRLMYTSTGVLLSLIQTSLPLAVLPIVSALRNVPPSIEEAAASLGANRIRTIAHIVFPLSLPGVIAGSLLVFAWNASAFVVPRFLGGGRVQMLALRVEWLMGALLHWPLGSAVAILLIAIALVVLVIYGSISTRYLER
jgi:putative spermidine/putrescine transport system permease protein